MNHVLKFKYPPQLVKGWQYKSAFVSVCSIQWH